jgi:4-amino-4-deoxy-L-arabinose transferase-like glycosyltransferase
MPINTDVDTRIINSHSLQYKVALVLFFVLAALTRIIGSREPVHLVEREYNSAIFARDFYYQNNIKIEPWRQENSRVTREIFPTLEPPVTEYLVSWIYRLTVQEHIWYSHYLTTAFWLISGIFLYAIAARLISVEAAFFATVIYLFLPWGIIISRSFQPDALMMLMFLMSLFFIVRYFEKLNLVSAVLAGVVTGLTLLFRPLVSFQLLCAFVVLLLFHQKSWKALFSRQVLIFFAISLSLPALFYAYGIFMSGSLQNQASLSFRPHLLLRPRFWREWLELGTSVSGNHMVISAFLGFFFLNKIKVKILLLGLLIGYLIFGIVFTYHIITHPYYHIQLFPLLAISASVFVVFTLERLQQFTGRYWILPALGAFLILFYFNYQELRSNQRPPVFESPQLAAEIGELVQHNSRTVFVAYHYGVPLVYYGEFAGKPWPVRIDDAFYRPPDEKEKTVEERLLSLGFEPEYFIITNFDLYNRMHQDLRAYLESNCQRYQTQAEFLIYNSCLRK